MVRSSGGSGGGGGRIWLGLAFERRGHVGRPPSSPPEVLPTPPAPLPEPPPTFRKSKWSFKPELIGDTPHFPVPLLGREGVRARNKILRVVISREELQSAAAQLRALVSDLEVVQRASGLRALVPAMLSLTYGISRTRVCHCLHHCLHHCLRHCLRSLRWLLIVVSIVLIAIYY